MNRAEAPVWVVDASVAFGWFVESPGSEQAMRLLNQAPQAQLLAPDLVLVELLNAGWKARRAGAITEEQWQGMGELAPGSWRVLILQQGHHQADDQVFLLGCAFGDQQGEGCHAVIGDAGLAIGKK